MEITGIILGLYWDNGKWKLQGLYWGYIGIMENKMETIGIIGIMLGLYWDNGK